MSSSTYTTRQGDTWDVIAHRLWGQERLMHRLVQANPDHADVLVFGPDVVLIVPGITVPVKTAELPPWFSSSGGKV